MSNDMMPKPVFDYGLVTEDQAMQLREIAIRLGVRVQRTAEEMLAMGADLREAKRVCKEDGTLFSAWCASSECPINGMRTVERLMAVHAALGDRNDRAVVFDYGFRVLADVTQTRDEDIRAALLEHIEKEAEDGNKVTQKEITALKKALKDAQLKAVELEESAFDARQERDRILAEKDKLAAREKEAREKKDQYARDLIEADKARKAIEAEYAAKLRATAPLNEFCGARTRKGTPCRRKDIYQSGRCRLHGGLSTGPKTEAGKEQSRINGKRGGRPKRNPTP